MPRPPSPRVAFDSVTKRFGNVVANDAITCDVATGGIHAFLGENGAGKSTLMKILSGAYRPDDGRVLIDGSPADFRSPAEARRAGIGMVHQHLSLVPSMSVLDNIILGDDRVSFLLRRGPLAEQVSARAQRSGFEFDLKARVADLSISERQRIEIFKLLWRDARVLILDEPTSQLAPFEAEDILLTMRQLAVEGRTILLVSHNIGEVIRFASRISVLTKGRCVDTFDSGAIRMEELARLMVGDLDVSPASRIATRPLESLLTLTDVCVRPSEHHRAITDITFDIYAGEVLGIAGVAHSGQEEIAAVLTGHLQPDRGSLAINGVPCRWNVLQQRASCPGYIPADGRRDASISSLSLTSNLFLRDIFRDNIVDGPFLQRAEMVREAKRRLTSFDVQPGNPDLPAGALSGGNLQRLVLARELAHESSFLVAVNPTAGLDITATHAVRARLREHAGTGRSVVLISHDLNELIATCDRVIVLFNGEIVGIESTDALNADSVGLLMGGVKAEIVRAVLGSEGGPSDGAAELRAALRKLLSSENRWQRHIGAQAGLRVFDAPDASIVRAQMAAESYEDTRIWLSLILARVVGGPELEALIPAFAQNPFGYVEAQRKIYGSHDHASLGGVVVERITDHAGDWEIVLGVLTLDYLGVPLGDELSTALSSCDLPSVLRLAKVFHEDGVVGRR